MWDCIQGRPLTRLDKSGQKVVWIAFDDTEQTARGPMTEAEWLECDDPQKMQDYLTNLSRFVLRKSVHEQNES